MVDRDTDVLCKPGSLGTAPGLGSEVSVHTGWLTPCLLPSSIPHVLLTAQLLWGICPPRFTGLPLLILSPERSNLLGGKRLGSTPPHAGFLTCSEPQIFLESYKHSPSGPPGIAVVVIPHS